MITEINIKNFKSIVDLTLPLSNINVFIGENGCGKSNILEAIGFASLADIGINTESLSSKGVRNAKPSLIFNSFKEKKRKNNFSFNFISFNQKFKYTFEVSSKNKSDLFPEWIQTTVNFLLDKNMNTIIKEIQAQVGTKTSAQTIRHVLSKVIDRIQADPDLKEEFLGDFFNNERDTEELDSEEGYLEQFLIYSPSTLALRGLQVESQKEPLGIYGENLDVLFASFSNQEKARLSKYHRLISWLDDLIIDQNDKLKLDGYKVGRSHSKLYFRDKFMGKSNNLFSAENANEGVLHVLFYLVLFISERTPKFFGIDNIETALNPKLCRTLIKALSEIATENGKQVLITTHHPAILDGLNLHDDRQRLFVVKRNDEGHTQIERIKLKPETNGEKLKLSEMWMRGLIGGLPTNF